MKPWLGPVCLSVCVCVCLRQLAGSQDRALSIALDFSLGAVATLAFPLSFLSGSLSLAGSIISGEMHTYAYDAACTATAVPTAKKNSVACLGHVKTHGRLNIDALFSAKKQLEFYLDS